MYRLHRTTWPPTALRRAAASGGTSAIVPLVVAEASTESVQAIAEEDPVMCVWWGTEIDCASAVARLEREDSLTAAATMDALRRLDLLAEAWNEVQPVAALRGSARRLLRVHPSAQPMRSNSRPPSSPLRASRSRLSWLRSTSGWQRPRGGRGSGCMRTPKARGSALVSGLMPWSARVARDRHPRRAAGRGGRREGFTVRGGLAS